MELNTDQALQQGVAAQKEGRLQDAERCYRTILQAQPDHPDANHNLGVLAVAVGKPLEAVPLFKAALKANPKAKQFWLSYADALIKLEQFDEAKRILVEGEKSGVLLGELDTYKQRPQASVTNGPNKTEKGQKLSEKRKRLAEKKKNKKRKSPSQSLSAAPSQDQINHLLGHYQAGRLEEAKALATLLTQQFANHPFGWKVLGVVLKQTGRLAESLEPMQIAATLSQQDAEAHNNLGITLYELERFGAAEASYRQAIALKPDYADAHNNLGVTLKELGRFDEAETSYGQAITLKPDYAEAHNNLGVILNELGRLDEAEASYGQAIALKPDYAEAHNNLGIALNELRRFDEAEASYGQAITLEPDYAEAHNNLGATLNELGRCDEAEASCERAITLKPEFAEAHTNLGNPLKELGRLDEAEASYKQAIVFKPSLTQAHSNLGLVLQDLGRFNEAAASFGQATALEPHLFEPRNNLLFVLNYDPAFGSAELMTEYEAFGKCISDLTKYHFTHEGVTPIRGRRIRVGYSSPDFRGHACRFFMEPLFRNHDRDQFELFAYSNTLNPDQHTERMKSYFDHWIDVGRMTDEDMAQRIYDDQIDILVDMAGHTKGNRLPVFAMRPAPIQASSWIGFGYTTGLKEIDYFICDENVVPAGSECYFSEEPWRLPAPGCAYEPPADLTPEVSELPALRNGYVTFGSLTRTVRINDPLLRVWSEILERVPNSRLRLDQKPFAYEGVRELFWERFEELGLPRERVELTCSTSHWSAYHDIDITLDCWPHNAGTTTLESLWMGVPVLSKMDRPSVGRIGAAALKPLGLEDWLVETAEAYVEKAVSFASDLDALAELRAELRNRVDQGPHLDAATTTGHLENAYREMLSLGGSPNR